MTKEDVVIKVNANFHRVAGRGLFRKSDSRFKTYRENWQKWPQGFQVGEFPLFIDIEVTSICNLKCPFCATTFWRKKIKNGFVSFETVKKIINEGRENNLYGVKFNLRGEPLLHPEIHNFVKYAKENGLVDVYFNTNALLLTEQVSKRLIDAGLDRLSISVEGYTKDVYEKYRVGSNFETILTNIKNLQLLKKRRGVTHPKIRIQAVLLPELQPNFMEYKRFWAKYADEVAYLDYKEMKKKNKGIKYPWACPQVWQRMAVWWDGTVLPCNHDDDGLLALGNIHKISIKEAWHSDKLSHLRDVHKKGLADKISSCDGCYLRDSEILKLK